MIYLDHAASTDMRPEVTDAMLPFLEAEYGNPSSLHQKGEAARRAVEIARAAVARLIHSAPEEILFTSGGSEADNFAVKGFLDAHPDAALITSPIEHKAILETGRYLQHKGVTVLCVPVNEYGRICTAELEKICQGCLHCHKLPFVSIQAAGNEIGTLQPVEEIAKLVHRSRGVFHTDAVQLIAWSPMDVKEAGIDLMSVSGHKINGPKGTGFLYRRNGISLTPLIHGGGQEYGLRAGTENVAGIVGLGTAAGLLTYESVEHVKQLRDWLAGELLSQIPDCRINGDPVRRLPNHLHVSFAGIDGESLLLLLDAYGVCVSSGSACSSRSVEPSHVLKAIGVPERYLYGSLRITLSAGTTEDQLREFLNVLVACVRKLRA